MLDLNTIKPSEGSRPNAKRVGRGIGSGLGKTCGRGHKGQHSRSGGYHKLGFEGGQMPIQRRLPKFGFKSRVSRHVGQVTLSELNKVAEDVVDVLALKSAGLIKKHVTDVKVILSGELTHPVKVRGLRLTKGAQEALVKSGGEVIE